MSKPTLVVSKLIPVQKGLPLALYGALIHAVYRVNLNVNALNQMIRPYLFPEMPYSFSE
jgi:hypothetical protein